MVQGHQCPCQQHPVLKEHLEQPKEVAEEGRSQRPSCGVVQDPGPPRKRAHLCPEAGRILATALRAPLTPALALEKLLIALARATVMAGLTASTLGPWGSHPGPWAETAIWLILTPYQQQSLTCWEACGCILQGCTSSMERPAPAHTHQTALSRFISGSHADLGVSALLPKAPDAWRVFSSSWCEGS